MILETLALKLLWPLKWLLAHLGLWKFAVALKAALAHSFSSFVAFAWSGIHGALVGMFTIFTTIGWLKLSGVDPVLIDWLRLLIRLTNPLSLLLFLSAFTWGALLVKRGRFFVGNLPVALSVFAFVVPTLLDMSLALEITTYFASLTAFWAAFAYYIGTRLRKRHRKERRLLI